MRMEVAVMSYVVLGGGTGGTLYRDIWSARRCGCRRGLGMSTSGYHIHSCSLRQVGRLQYVENVRVSEDVLRNAAQRIIDGSSGRIASFDNLGHIS
jgi:hypothetical protein